MINVSVSIKAEYIYNLGGFQNRLIFENALDKSKLYMRKSLISLLIQHLASMAGLCHMTQVYHCDKTLFSTSQQTHIVIVIR